MEAIKLNVNQLGEWAPKLHAGDRVLLSGTVYTSRDAAHKRYFGLLDEGKPLPFDIKGAAIYYAGPTGDAASSCNWKPVDQLRRGGWIHMHRVCWTWD